MLLYNIFFWHKMLLLRGWKVIWKIQWFTTLMSYSEGFVFWGVRCAVSACRLESVPGKLLKSWSLVCVLPFLAFPVSVVSGCSGPTALFPQFDCCLFRRAATRSWSRCSPSTPTLPTASVSSSTPWGSTSPREVRTRWSASGTWMSWCVSGASPGQLLCSAVLAGEFCFLSGEIVPSY